MHGSIHSGSWKIMSPTDGDPYSHPYICTFQQLTINGTHIHGLDDADNIRYWQYWVMVLVSHNTENGWSNTDWQSRPCHWLFHYHPSPSCLSLIKWTLPYPPTVARWFLSPTAAEVLFDSLTSYHALTWPGVFWQYHPNLLHKNVLLSCYALQGRGESLTATLLNAILIEHKQFTVIWTLQSNENFY